MIKKQDLNKILLKRLLAIFIIGTMSVIGVVKYAPKIGSIFGLISVNRNDTITPPEANTPPPIFLGVPEAVNKTKIDLKGSSVPKTKIELFVNGPKEASVLTDISGEFLFTNVKLNEGKNTIFAKANETKSDVITIRYDNEKPKIELETPKNGEKIENLNNRVEVIGKINEEAAVKVNGRVAIQRPDNSFSILLGAREGNLEIIIEATDLAGNKSEEKLSVTYKHD